ncbi:ATP-binding cassette domain-containing protein [Streptococcus suis]|uniref:ATP-binding cassette domain-containing protein n=1 Tax=Streptococcus suis TaxID=1307 RepID=UPI001ABE94D2|nr:ABC transporter ATP-binding protein [Streptococcus suis]
MSEVLIQLENIEKEYTSKTLFGKKTLTKAVDQVSLKIVKGETLGLVGESGSGKSTLAKLILGLEKPSQGQLKVHLEKDKSGSQGMQVVFQDPYSSLNPYMTALELVREPLDHLDHKEADGIASKILERVGIVVADQGKKPAAFSGGQRQRIGIARAIVSRPSFVVCDEPTSALDVSTQARIIQLLTDLQVELGLSYLFISHDLNLVRKFADRIAVMYRGKIVEIGPSKSVFETPGHPYTRYLLSANLSLDPSQARKQLTSLGQSRQEFQIEGRLEEWRPGHFVLGLKPGENADKNS